jgi:hypothetical protein
MFQRHFAVFVLVFFAAIVPPAGAQVEPNQTVYIAKFFCGFTDGRVVRLNDPTPLPAPYRAVEPGNYATVINITSNTLTSIQPDYSVSISAQGFAPSLHLPTPELDNFEVLAIDCRDITARLAEGRGFVNDGRYVEGYITIVSDLYDPVILSLEVNAAYTYAVQKADTNGTGLGSSLQVLRIEGQPKFQPE